MTAPTVIACAATSRSGVVAFTVGNAGDESGGSHGFVGAWNFSVAVARVVDPNSVKEVSKFRSLGAGLDLRLKGGLARAEQLEGVVSPLFVRVDQFPVEGDLLFERSGFRLSETPGGLTAPGPRLGEHNHEILSNILGLTDAAIESALIVP